MHISWLGQTCVRLQTKYLDEDVVILMDAYRPETGEFPRNFGPTIATFSAGKENAATVGNAFVLDTLGEIELKEAMVTSFPTNNGSIVYKINAEGLSVVHLGRLKHKQDVAELEKIGTVDILIVPVGGYDILNAEDAAAIATAMEPRIVIPMAYQCDTDKKAEPVSVFIKEMGLKPEATDKKFIFKKKDLPQEDMKLYVLEKNV